MKTRQLDKGKRKFFFKSALALAALKLGFSNSTANASAGSSSSVEDRIASLEHEVMRLQAINEIENLM